MWVKRLGLIVYGGKEGGGDIGGGNGDESIDDYSHTLLTLIACHTTCDSSKAALGDAHLLPLGKMGIRLGDNGNIAIVHGTYDAQTLHLTFWNDEGTTDNFTSYCFLGIIEAKKWKVGIVIDKTLYLQQSAVGEKNVGDTGHTNLPALAIYLLDLFHGGPIDHSTMRIHILVGQPFATIGGAKGVPMFIVYR